MLANKFYKVGEFEHNYHDDSYVYAILFNPVTKEESKDLVWTTAFGCDSNSDQYEVNEDVNELYERVSKLRRRLTSRAFLMQEAKGTGFTRHQIKYLHELSSDERVACLKLLKTKKFRSAFRQSMCEQVRNWLKDKDNGFATYDKPLSNKQFGYI